VPSTPCGAPIWAGQFGIWGSREERGGDEVNSADCGEEEMGEREFGIEKGKVFFIFGPPFLLLFPSLSLQTSNVFSLHVFLSFACAFFVQMKYSHFAAEFTEKNV
jgi:hypothetical protein